MNTIAAAFALSLITVAHALPVEMPSRFISPGSRVAPTNLESWWTRFGDAELTGLVATALAANPAVASAEARVREARSQKLEAASLWWPAITASAGFTQERFSSTGRMPGPPGAGSQGLYQSSLDASWEIDVFGRTRNAVAAAGADVRAAGDAQRGVFLTLCAEVADTYLELRGLQERARVVCDNVSALQEIVALTRDRVKAGLSPALIESQAQALLADTRASLPELEEGVRQAMFRLAFLCGQAPGFATRLEKRAAIPSGPTAPAPGTPTQLLARRPDIRQASQRLAAANARVSESRAARYPTVRVIARSGYESRKSGDFTQSDNRQWNVGPEVSVPLFTGGEITARIRQSEARRDGERAAYDRVVLGALADVEGALVAVRQRAARLSELTTAESANSQALTDAQSLFKAGGTDFLNVLSAQRAVLLAQDRTATARADAARAKVRLFKSLGGGW